MVWIISYSSLEKPIRALGKLAVRFHFIPIHCKIAFSLYLFVSYHNQNY